MLNPRFEAMLAHKSPIREIYDYGLARGKEIGYENVFDFTLGNPSVPVPDAVNDKLVEIIRNVDCKIVHGYSTTLGIYEVREKLAASLNSRFGMQYRAEHIFMTNGAASSLCHTMRAVCVPGDEVVVCAPFFAEYRAYAEGCHVELKVVPADTKHFQIDFEAFDAAFSEKTMAVLINTPNNPSGAVYSAKTIERLAALLREKERAYGHPIYLISDEPYREIVFDMEAPYVARYYDNTITCYSFSKSLSLPGARIGYIAVNPACPDAEKIVVMCGQISRGTGHNCPSALYQLLVGDCCGLTSDLSVYHKNRDILYNALVEMGYSVVKPDGAFYIFPRSLEPDAAAFCRRAMQYDLLLVAGDGFSCPGHFRAAYCVETEKLERSLDAFRKLADSYR